MSSAQALREVSRLCVDRLGAAAGTQLAAKALPGFGLVFASGARTPTGRCAFGGAALLDPGTGWPHRGETALELLAVLDLDALPPWLGDTPAVRPGLLNFFYDEDRGGCRVLPAGSARAVEVAPPPGAEAAPRQPLHAEPVITLPDVWDPALDDLRFGADRNDISMPGLEVKDKLEELWYEHTHTDQAFGWPKLLGTVPLAPAGGRPYVQLLQVEYQLGDGALLHFTIPEQALLAGDYTQAEALLDSA